MPVTPVKANNARTIIVPMPLNQEDYARLIAELTEANTAARSKKAELEVRKEAAEFNLNTFRNEKEALGIWILPSKSPGKCK
jgi:hypothetical protein